MFEIIDVSEGKKIGLRLGIRVKVGGQESICPFSGVFRSSQELSKALERLVADLERLSSQGRAIFGGEQGAGDQALSPDMPPDEIWEILSETADETRFIALFNHLSEEKREEIAEFVLTRCNVFSGRGAVFSARYNSETALLEE